MHFTWILSYKLRFCGMEKVELFRKAYEIFIYLDTLVVP